MNSIIRKNRATNRSLWCDNLEYLGWIRTRSTRLEKFQMISYGEMVPVWNPEGLPRFRSVIRKYILVAKNRFVSKMSIWLFDLCQMVALIIICPHSNHSLCSETLAQWRFEQMYFKHTLHTQVLRRASCKFWAICKSLQCEKSWAACIWQSAKSSVIFHMLEKTAPEEQGSIITYRDQCSAELI